MGKGDLLGDFAHRSQNLPQRRGWTASTLMLSGTGSRLDSLFLDKSGNFSLWGPYRDIAFIFPINQVFTENYQEIVFKPALFLVLYIIDEQRKAVKYYFWDLVGKGGGTLPYGHPLRTKFA